MEPRGAPKARTGLAKKVTQKIGFGHFHHGLKRQLKMEPRGVPKAICTGLAKKVSQMIGFGYFHQWFKTPTKNGAPGRSKSPSVQDWRKKCPR